MPHMSSSLLLNKEVYVKFHLCMCSLWRQEKNCSFFPSKSGSIASAQNLDRLKSWSTYADSTTCRQMRNTVVSYQKLVLPCTIINAATSLPDFTARELMEAFYIASKRNTCISQTHNFFVKQPGKVHVWQFVVVYLLCSYFTGGYFCIFFQEVNICCFIVHVWQYPYTVD